MQQIFIQYVFLVLIILGLVMLANKLKIAYPIVLVIGGLLLSCITAFSDIIIQPDLVFFIFLPPLLFEAAWQTSWKEFWKWRRVITSFAFPIVIITSCVVAFAAKALIPGFTLSLGFLLGGIISPPDAISATTIMRQVKVPKSLISIIEGESLLNDASSLIVFRFALAAVLTGQFQLHQAIGSFFLVILMGVLLGLGVALVFYLIHRYLPTTPSIDTVLTLVAPYCMYYAAEHFHFSGVLAVVSGGLLLSGKRQQMLTYRSRIQGINVWTNLVFVLNGLIFFLIGLELPFITSQLGETTVGAAIGYGLTVSVILIAARLLCTFGASVFTRFMSRFITVADNNPGWKTPLIFGWAGMRGVVSLAAALSVPLLTATGQAFPYRNLILFITFIVILVTLVLQGLTLPWLIDKVKPEDKFSIIPEPEQRLILQKKMHLASLRLLETVYEREVAANAHVQNLAERLRTDVGVLEASLEPAGGTKESSSLHTFHKIYLELLQAQRDILYEVNHRKEFDEDLVRKYLSLVDLEELKVREKLMFDEEPAG